MPRVPACYRLGVLENVDLGARGIRYEATRVDEEESPVKLMEGADQDVSILEPFGRLDSKTAPEFGDQLMALVQAGRSAIVVDLKNIIYISSAGFRVLLIANRATAEKKGKLALCGITGEVRRLFEIGAFLDQFLICPTQADGIGKLKQ
jgi:anti-sigma B factor antagonist